MKNQRSIPGAAATAATAGDPILGVNGCRRSVIFSLTGINPVFLWPAGGNPANAGIQLVPTDPVLTLCQCDFAPLVPGEWYAWSPAGASSVSWVEVLDSSASPAEGR